MHGRSAKGLGCHVMVFELISSRPGGFGRAHLLKKRTFCRIPIYLFTEATEASSQHPGGLMNIVLSLRSAKVEPLKNCGFAQD